MLLTIHALERFAIRVMGREYSKDDKSAMEKHIKEMLDASALVWTGKYKDTANDADYYYHRDGYIFVTESNTVITVYNLDYGFGEEIDRQIYEALVKQINKLKKSIEKTSGSKHQEIAQKEQEITQTEIQITELRMQLELLEARRSKLISEKDFILTELASKQAELDTVAMKLINSMQYRMDLLAMKNKKGA